MIVYVVEVFDINHRVPTHVSRSREFVLKYGREIWKRAVLENGSNKPYAGVYKVQVWKVFDHCRFKMIKRFQ